MLDALILRAIGPILTAVGSLLLASGLAAIIVARLLGVEADR